MIFYRRGFGDDLHIMSGFSMSMLGFATKRCFVYSFTMDYVHKEACRYTIFRLIIVLNWHT